MFEREFGTVVGVLFLIAFHKKYSKHIIILRFEIISE